MTELHIPTVQACIEYMRARPGRRGVNILEAMLKQEKAKQTKPAPDHPWRKMEHKK